ncbi:uncharacterized protein LOC141626554 [Silene latifolia]|uniref:uncharacterized protein LOC141626554 n=1 Tax=Silene latifolia TaxID=37657 RepID=UPI003D774047
MLLRRPYCASSQPCSSTSTSLEMASLGNRRSRGRGSGSQSQYDDEDRLLTEEELLAQWINGSLSSLPNLAPDVLWFDNNKVKKVVRAAIVAKFDKFAPSYTAATLEQKEDWWNRFKSQFKYQRYCEPEINAALLSTVLTGSGTWSSERRRVIILGWKLR